MKLITLSLVFLATTSCALPTQPNFLRMTPEELAAFNLTASESDQVFCLRTQRGSVARYVSRRRCGTMEEIRHLLGRSYTLPTETYNEFFSMDRYRN